MGIGRREFLTLFGTTLVVCATQSTQAIAVLDGWYINRKLGIAFRSPEGWFFSDMKDMGEVKAGQLLDLDDQELVQKIIEDTELPILAISKTPITPESYEFSPGITI